MVVAAGGRRRECGVAEGENERLGGVGQQQFTALSQETVANQHQRETGSLLFCCLHLSHVTHHETFFLWFTSTFCTCQFL